MKGAKPLAIPGSTCEESKEGGEGEVKLLSEKAFRGIAAKLNYLSLDRPDLQYVSRSISKAMSNPTHEAMRMLKRVGRYLIGSPRLVQKFPWTQKAEQVVTYGDSNWAGDKKDAKSTSGGALYWNGHCLKCWSSTQQIVALSSGEAELYALTKAATESVGIMSLLSDFGIKVKAIVLSDSSAAIGIVSREGVGKTRHINVRHLWLQQKVAEKEFEIRKVEGPKNVADLMTKCLAKAEIDRHLKALKMEVRGPEPAKMLAKFKSFSSDRWVKADKEKIQKRSPKEEDEEKISESRALPVTKAQQDQLLSEAVEGGALLRMHSKAREALFTPKKVPRGPGKAEEVGDVRLTAMTTAEGCSQLVIDNWKESPEPHRRVDVFTGWTAFVRRIPDSVRSRLARASHPWFQH